MQRLKTVFIWVTIIAVLTGITFAVLHNEELSVDAVKKDPEKQIAASYSKTADSLQNCFSQSPLSILVEALKNGRVKLWTTSNQDVSDALSLYSNQENSEYTITLESKSETNIYNTSFYMNKQAFVVAAPHAFGDTVYGVNLQTMQQDMTSSNLWAFAGTSYNEVKPMFDSIMAVMEKLGKDNEDPEHDDYAKMLEDINEIVQQCTVTIEEHGILVGTEVVTAINVKYTISAEQLSQIANVYLAWAESSILNDIISLDGFGLVNNFAQQKEGAVSTIESQSDIIIDEFQSAVVNACTGVDFTVSINPKNKMIMKTEMVLAYIDEDKVENISVSIDFGEDPASSNLRQIIFTKTNSDMEDTSLSIIYEVMDATGIYDRRLKIKYSDPDTVEGFSVQFQWDKTEGTYVLKLDDNGDISSVGGKCQISDKKLELSTDTLNEESVLHQVSLHITAEIGIPVPVMPQYTNILTAPDEDIQKLISAFKGTREPNNNILDMPDNSTEESHEDITIEVSYTTASGTSGAIDITTSAKNLCDLLLENGIIETTADGMIITKLIGSGDPADTKYIVFVNEIPIVTSLKNVIAVDGMKVAIDAKG